MGFVVSFSYVGVLRCVVAVPDCLFVVYACRLLLVWFVCGL